MRLSDGLPLADDYKMVASFNSYRTVLIPPAMFYLHKSYMRLKMGYCCHLWDGAENTHFPALIELKSIYASLWV